MCVLLFFIHLIPTCKLLEICLWNFWYLTVVQLSYTRDSILHVQDIECILQGASKDKGVFNKKVLWDTCQDYTCEFLFFDRQKDKIKFKHAKTGGAPYVHRQYAKKAQPKATKEGKNLERTKITNTPITQQIQKREIVQVHNLLRPLKKRP